MKAQISVGVPTLRCDLNFLTANAASRTFSPTVALTYMHPYRQIEPLSRRDDANTALFLRAGILVQG